MAIFNSNAYKNASGHTYVWHCSPEADLHIIQSKASPKQKEAGIYVAPTFFDSVCWAVSFIAWKKSLRNKGGRGKYSQLTFFKLKIPRLLLSDSWMANDWEKELFIEKSLAKQLTITSRKTIDTKKIGVIYNQGHNLKYEMEHNRAWKQAGKSNLAVIAYDRLMKEAKPILLKIKPDSIIREHLTLAFKNLKNNAYSDDDFTRIGPAKKLTSVKQIKNVNNIIKSIEDLLRQIK